MNIVTGFHLFDDEQHLFVLEGRKQDAIDVLYEKLPKPEGKSRTNSLFSIVSTIFVFSSFFKDVEILYDSSIHFNERLYVKFGPDIVHIKLSRKLRDIVSQPLIFVRDTLPKETFEALDKLNQVETNIFHLFSFEKKKMSTLILFFFSSFTPVNSLKLHDRIYFQKSK